MPRSSSLAQYAIRRGYPGAPAQMPDFGGPAYTPVGNSTGLGGGDGGFRPLRSGLLGSAQKSPFGPTGPEMYSQRLSAARMTPGGGLMNNAMAQENYARTGYMPNVTVGGAFPVVREAMAPTGLRQRYADTIASAQFGGLRPGMMQTLGGQRQGFLRPAIPSPTPQASAAGVRAAMAEAGGLGQYAREVPGVARQNNRAVAISPDNRVMEMTPQQIRVAGLSGRAPWAKGPTEQELAANRQAYQEKRRATLSERQANVTRLRQQEAQQRQQAQYGGQQNAFLNVLAMRNPELAVRMMEANQRGLLAQQGLQLQQQGLTNEFALGNQRNQNDARRNELLDQQAASERGLKFAEAAQQEEANAIAYMQAGRPKEAAAARQRAAAYRQQGASAGGLTPAQPAPITPVAPAQQPPRTAPAGLQTQSLLPEELDYVRQLPAGDRRAWLKGNTRLQDKEIQAILDQIEGPSLGRDARRMIGSGLGSLLGEISDAIIPGEIDEIMAGPGGLLAPQTPPAMPAIRGVPIQTPPPQPAQPKPKGLTAQRPNAGQGFRWWGPFGPMRY